MPEPFVLCLQCLSDGKVRTAWTVADGAAVCVRHAVVSLGIEDDMREHFLFEDIYYELHRLGFRDTC